MRLEPELTIRRLPASGPDEVPRSELLLSGVPTARVIDGAVLEAAVGWEANHLLFLTDDIPFEEMLRIVLLDKNLDLVDKAMLGAIYSTGSFSGLQLREPNQVQFRFIGGTDWTVRLLPHPQFRLPFLSEPRGVSRAVGFSRHFTVHGNPMPAR